MKLTLEQIEAYIDGSLERAQLEEVEKALSEDKMCKMVYDYLVSDDEADYDESKSYPNLDDRSLIDSLSEKIQMGISQPLFYEGESSVFASILSETHDIISNGSSNELNNIEALATVLFQPQIDQIEHLINDSSEEFGTSEQFGFSSEL